MSLRISLFKHLRATVRDVFADADVYPANAVPNRSRISSVNSIMANSPN